VQECLRQNELLRAENQQLREGTAQLEEALGKGQRDYEWLKKLMNEKGANE